MVKELIKAHKEAEKITRALVELFNKHLCEVCDYFDTDSEATEELFMNCYCNHSKGNGHCCIALCPLEDI